LPSEGDWQASAQNNPEAALKILKLESVKKTLEVLTSVSSFASRLRFYLFVFVSPAFWPSVCNSATGGKDGLFQSRLEYTFACGTPLVMSHW
jgi:hypothetical protein